MEEHGGCSETATKKRGLLAVRRAADADVDFFTQSEARFALSDMQVLGAELTGGDRHRPHSGPELSR